MGKQIPNFYAMHIDELSEYMAGERERTQKLIAKQKKTKTQVERLGKAEQACKTVKKVSHPSVLERLKRMFSGEKE